MKIPKIRVKRISIGTGRGKSTRDAIKDFVSDAGPRYFELMKRLGILAVLLAASRHSWVMYALYVVGFVFLILPFYHWAETMVFDVEIEGVSDPKAQKWLRRAWVAFNIAAAAGFVWVANYVIMTAVEQLIPVH